MTFNGTKQPLRRLGSIGVLAMIGLTGLLSGCLDRKVGRTQPETNNIFVTQNPSGGIDKIDILFMIDNSLSMGDKQAVLAAAVPQLLGRLTNPDCISEDGTQRVSMAQQGPNAECGADLQREFAPVKDIHIGVVSSSLGDFGGDVCPENPSESTDSGFPDQNDKGWLLGALPRNSGTLGSDFLSWTKDDANNYGTQLGVRTEEFRNHVAAAGEVGCGLEMILESWYRFLIDPDPPEDVIAEGSAGNKLKVARKPYAAPNPILAQRAQFLRSDSLVAVVMLADENDCSLRDSNAYSWVPAQAGGSFRSFKPSSICASNPNDKCCFSCLQQLTGELPEGCSPDPVCEGGGKLAPAEDPTGLRCFHMKQRFGFDFLFPVTRYSNALSLKQICPNQTYGDLDCECTAAKRLGVPCEPNGTPIPNPLYENLSGTPPTGPDRDGPGVVFFAGIVGVPWQDLATDDAVANAATPLQFKVASQLNWDSFAPTDIYAANPALDPLMVEAVAPRPGLPGPASGLLENPINGHEWNTGNNDLQYACVFSLEELGTRTCDQSVYCANAADPVKCKRAFVGCSCSKYADGYTENSPLCQTDAGTYSNVQRYAKAYPGVRELQALRAFHELNGQTNNAIVASICPKSLAKGTEGTSGYGYNPAVAALVDRLKEKLGGTCLPRPLTADKETGKVPCAVVEVIPNSAGNQEWCNCAAKQRRSVESELQDAVKGALERQGTCGGETAVSCDDYCFCELEQLQASDPVGVACLTAPNVEKSSPKPGYCYVDPAQASESLKAGESSVVAGCPASEKRQIRIVGDGAALAAPAPGYVFIACSGAPYKG
jgi:hypothetical protein